jgi:uncharacterized protein (TIGR02284 family)
MSFVRAGKTGAFGLPTNRIFIKSGFKYFSSFFCDFTFGTSLAHMFPRNLLRKFYSDKGAMIMATTDADNVISTLNTLIQTCRDAADGFREAAQGVKNDELQQLMTRYSEQRTQFVSELQDEVRKLGAEPENSGSIAASLHRGWINIREALQGNDDTAVINECERGEEVAVDSYRDALKQALPSDVMSMVERQYMQIREAHDRIQSLGNISSAATS